MDIPNQSSDSRDFAAASDKVRAFSGNPAAIKAAGGAGGLASSVAAARFPVAAKVAKGAADQHYKRNGGLNSQVEAPHTGIHTLADVSNWPFNAWAAGGIGGFALSKLGKIPVIGSPFTHASDIAHATSGAMNTKLNELHRFPETFLGHWLYDSDSQMSQMMGGAKDRGPKSYFSPEESLEKGKGLFGRKGSNGRFLRWVGDKHENSIARGNRVSEKLAALPESEGVGKAVFGEAGALSKAAGAFGWLTNPFTSIFANKARGNVHGHMGKARGAAGSMLANLAHLDKRSDIIERQLDKKGLLAEIREAAEGVQNIVTSNAKAGAGKHYYDDVSKAFTLGEGGGVHNVQEHLEALRTKLASARNGTYVAAAENTANAAILPNPATAMESVKRTAKGVWEKGSGLMKTQPEREANKLIAAMERDVASLEKSLGKAIASHGRAELLSDMKQLPSKLGKWAGNMSLHEASFLGMLGFGAVAKVQDHVFHRKHRGQMADQLRSDMAEAGIDPYNSSIAQTVNSAKSKKGWVDVATTTGHVAMDGVFLSMMGGHGSEAAKVAEKAIPKMPKVKGLGGVLLPAAIGLQVATMMGGNALKGSIAPVLESYTDMKAMETAGEKPPVEAYAQLLSAFSPKMAEYGMNSRLVKALAEQYAAEGLTAIEVVKEVDRQMPLDQRVAKVEQEFVKKDVDVAHKTKAGAAASIEGGEHVDAAEKVSPETQGKESFVARLEAERSGKPLTKKPLVNASATPPAALNQAPPAKLELADASLEGLVNAPERQLVAQ